MKEEYGYNDRSLPGNVPENCDESEGYYADLTEKDEKENDRAYKTVMDGVPRSRGWSVASMILGILSILLSFIPFTGVVLGTVSIITALISRRNLGYFDGIAIAGIITGAIGSVFGIMSLVIGFLFS